MSVFGGLILTNKGRNLLIKGQLGAVINYTRIAIGDGSLSGSSILDLNALKNQVKTFSITKLKALTGGRFVVGTTFSNNDITSGFYYRELGLFAQDPDLGEILYGYANAGALAEYISSGGGADLIEKAIDIEIIVGNASSVTATINSSLVYASAQDLINGINDLAGTGRTSETIKGNADAIATKETPAGAQAKANTAETNAKGYTDTKILELINAAPGALDTLDELANALGDDPNFRTTILNAIAAKAPQADLTALSNSVATSLAEIPKLEVATGVANALILESKALDHRRMTTFISNVNNNGTATTINGKPLYKMGTSTPPTLYAWKIYKVWYDAGTNGGTFFLIASAEGNTIPSHVLAGDTYSTFDDVGLVGTMPNYEKNPATNDFYYAISAQASAEYVCMEVPTGYHVQGLRPAGAGRLIYHEPNFVPSNMLAGKTYFGLEGTASNIKSIQRGVAYIPINYNATFPITISNVDMTKAIVLVTLNSNGVSSNTEAIGQLTSNTNLLVWRSGTTADAYVSWQVIEFNNVKSFQQGEYNMYTPTSASVTVSSVDPSKSILFSSYWTSGNDGLRSDLPSATRIDFFKSDANTRVIRWQLVEFY